MIHAEPDSIRKEAELMVEFGLQSELNPQNRWLTNASRNGRQLRDETSPQASVLW